MNPTNKLNITVSNMAILGPKDMAINIEADAIGIKYPDA